MKNTMLAILRVLNLVGDRALPFNIIATHVRGELVMPASDADILAAIRQCQEQGWIDKRVDAFDKSELWFLVDAGRIAMRSRQ